MTVKCFQLLYEVERTIFYVWVYMNADGEIAAPTAWNTHFRNRIETSTSTQGMSDHINTINYYTLVNHH